jgi:putative (di)nucleoside polyphosphate hydrolase
MNVQTSDETGDTRYRPNVGLALFHPDGRVFIGKRIGINTDDAWQMPQGGMDEGETPLAAALRELEEEIGVPPQLVDVLEESADWIYYDFPPEIREAMKKRGNYLGQKQKWFAFRFKGEDSDVRLDSHEAEFSEWRWGNLALISADVIAFKRAAYEKVAQRFARYTVGTQR